MDWSAIITIVLGSSLLGALLNSIAGYWIKRKESAYHATFIALNLAHLFEKYAEKCLSVSIDQEHVISSAGHIGAYINKIPEMASFPDYDYKLFDLALLDNVFDFRQQIEFAQKNLSFAIEILDGEEIAEQGYESCLQLAQTSLTIADAIRAKYNLEIRKLKFGNYYSVRDQINEKLKKE